MQALVTRFGGMVRRLREARGWSQERLAGLAELNRSYMGEVERGSVMPSLATAAKLAQALGVPLSALISCCEQETASAPALGTALATALVAALVAIDG
jgi:transcriptional regulator with XRE-family HTH domain